MRYALDKTGWRTFLPRFCFHKTYFPTTTITNESGFILPRRSPGAGGSKSAAGIKILCVFKSRPMVRALRLVGTFSTTVYLSGESSCTTVRMPSPQEAKKSFVAGSKAVASGPLPISGVATTLPVSAFITTETLSSQTAYRRRFLVSMDKPDGDLHGAIGQRCVSVIFCESI